MANTEEKLSVSTEEMQMAGMVGPRATIESIRLVNFSTMLGDVSAASFKFTRHARNSSFTRTNEDRLVVDIRFSLDFATTEEEKNEPPISMEGKYRLTYRVDDIASLDDAHLRAFSQINGYFNAWPFWRELTTSMLARTQAGLFLLPTLRVTSSPTTDSLD